MKLFLISQDYNVTYDVFENAVVAATDEEDAKLIHPGNYNTPRRYWAGNWCPGPEYVKVKYLGEADSSIERGVICASFNAS